MKFANGHIKTAIELVSEERFAQFRHICNSDENAVILHQHSTMLSAGLMPVIGLIEIALRNSADLHLTNYFGREDWMTAPAIPFRWKGDENGRITKAKLMAQRAIYSKMTNLEKHSLDALAFPNGVRKNQSHSVNAKKRQAQIVPSKGKIIAQLTIYFWKRLFSYDYDSTLWRPALKKVFPQKSIGRADVAQHLENIYQMRNRVAHHEVIFPDRVGPVLEAVDFVSNNLGVDAPSDDTPLSHLVRPHREILDERLDQMKKFILQVKKA